MFLNHAAARAQKCVATAAGLRSSRLGSGSKDIVLRKLGAVLEQLLGSVADDDASVQAMEGGDDRRM
jgi:hypothetical protein